MALGLMHETVCGHLAPLFHLFYCVTESQQPIKAMLLEIILKEHTRFSVCKDLWVGACKDPCTCACKGLCVCACMGMCTRACIHSPIHAHVLTCVYACFGGAHIVE